MKVQKHWFPKKGRLVPAVTVLWLPGEVSIVSWLVDNTCQLVPASATRIPSLECGSGRYIADLKSVLKEVPLRKVRKVWILPEEMFPSNYDGNGDKCRFVPVLPQWMQDCWEGLPALAFPDRMVPGLEAVRNNLNNWDTFKHTGTGFHFRLQDRSLFFGFAPEAVQTRVSRLSLKPGDLYGLDPDWVRQTQSLYQSRSGHELQRILLSESVSGTKVSGIQPETGIEVLYTGFPDNSIHVDHLDLDPAVAYLHSCGVPDAVQGVGTLPVALLERMRGRERWGNRFRGACALLVLGWFCALLGACRSEPGDLRGDPENFMEWEGQRRMWKMKHSEWRVAQEKINRGRTPFIIAGSLAASLPEEIRLHRLSIRDSGALSEDVFSIEMEGTCSGPEAPDIFRSWLESAALDPLLLEARSLKISQLDNVLDFSLRTRFPVEKK